MLMMVRHSRLLSGDGALFVRFLDGATFAFPFEEAPGIFASDQCLSQIIDALVLL